MKIEREYKIRVDLLGLSRIVRGMGQKTRGIESKGEVVRLWTHEVQRVWRDGQKRLEEEERVDEVVKEVVEEVLRQEVNSRDISVFSSLGGDYQWRPDMSQLKAVFQLAQ